MKTFMIIMQSVIDSRFKSPHLLKKLARKPGKILTINTLLLLTVVQADNSISVMLKLMIGSYIKRTPSQDCFPLRTSKTRKMVVPIQLMSF